MIANMGFLHQLDTLPLDSSEMSDPTPLACSQLYGESSCGQAWDELFRNAHKVSGDAMSPGGPPDLSSVVAPCTAAYCRKLGDPKPRLCSEPPLQDNAVLVAEVKELDTAILSFELKDPQLAAALAWKSSVFRVIRVAMSPPAPARSAPAEGVPMVLSVQLDAQERLAGDGKSVTDDELLTKARAAREQNPDIRATIRSDQNVRHGKVIHVLDLLKQAGVNKIAFGVTTE